MALTTIVGNKFLECAVKEKAAFKGSFFEICRTKSFP